MYRRQLILWICLLLLISACSSGSAYQRVTEAQLRPGGPIPVPTGTVILSLTGRIGVTNVQDRLDLDMEMLESIGMIEYQVDDPEYNRTVTLRGPLLSDVLALAQTPDDAKELFATALNDYSTTIPMDVLKWPVIIATWRDGERLPFAEKGPIQIAFPNRDYKIDPVKFNPMWVWHLRTLTVE